MLNPGASTFLPPANTSLFIGAKEAVLLQTAKVQIYNPDKPDQALEVRAVLDTGSQQSYATQRVKDVLALESRMQQAMSIMTFGSDRHNARNCDIVKVGVVTRDGSNLEMDLFAVLTICKPLSAQPIDLCAIKHQHLSALDLAHSSDNAPNMEVDLLIGSNYYWDR